MYCQYTTRIKLNRSDARVLGILILSGEQSAYEIHKKIENKETEKPKNTTISRSMKRLEKRGLVKFIEEKELRRKKIYKITPYGIIVLLSTIQENKQLLLESHHFPEIEIIRKKFLEQLPEWIKNSQESSFLNAFNISPSFVDFLLNINEMLQPNIIKDINIFRELFINSKITQAIVISDIDRLHQNFILQHLPSIFLIQDYKKYPNSYPLQKNLNKALSEILDKKKIITDIKEECLSHLYLYIPIIGDPILACDGLCSKPCQN